MSTHFLSSCNLPPETAHTGHIWATVKKMNKWSSARLNHPTIKGKLCEGIFMASLIVFMTFFVHLFIERNLTNHTRCADLTQNKSL
jgi:hypothetical protein